VQLLLCRTESLVVVFLTLELVIVITARKTVGFVNKVCPDLIFYF
jgi:hypothetical protein